MEEKQDGEVKVKGIELHCYCCKACLNIQEGFDNVHGSCECAECGYKNTLAYDNILVSEARYGALGKLYGWFRSAVLYIILILVSEHILQDDYNIRSTWLEDTVWIIFIAVVVLYVAMDIISMVMENRITHCRAEKSLVAYVVITPFLNLWEDFIRPFAETIKSLKSMFTQHGKPVFLIKSVICFIAYVVLVAALVYFGLCLLIYSAWIGL